MNLKKGKFLGAIVLSLFLLSSCRSLRNSNTLFQSKYDKFADSAKSVYVANPNPVNDQVYRIKPFDIIAIRNLQSSEGFVNSTVSESVQSGAVFRGDKNGIFTFSTLGPVNLDGLTLSAATTKIQDLYGRTLFKNPIIELTLVNYKVSLFGETTKPGNYQLEQERIDLIDLLGRSGGLSPVADAKHIKIIRGDRKNPEIIYVNLKDINSLSSEKIVLRNNDIVYIPAKGLYSTNENIKNYSSILQPAMLILNAALLIYTFAK